MDRATRALIESATQRARRLLEEDFAAQLEGDFDVLTNGTSLRSGGERLSPAQRRLRERIVAAIEHKHATGLVAADAVADYLRDAAFTCLNRFVALKMLEVRGLVQQCVSRGDSSSGYAEFTMLAKGIETLPNGYRIYLESIFDELSTEVKVLFDRRDPASALWPRRPALLRLLEVLNDGELTDVWAEDETIGWVYQYFNSTEERQAMRKQSQAPRNSRELAIRNQFFTPRYVVQFLTDNTLGRIWYEMRGGDTALKDRCEYLVRHPDEELSPRTKKDPRDIRVLDPACGSGHFLLYAFDLLAGAYQEAHADPDSPPSEITGRTLAQDYPDLDSLRGAVPGLILGMNLYGVDIDPRCAQIAQLALWMRAHAAYNGAGIGRSDRPRIRRSNVVIAEPLVAGVAVAEEFEESLPNDELRRAFRELIQALELAGELGPLLRVEKMRAAPLREGYSGDLFVLAQDRLHEALDRYAAQQVTRASTRRRLFADDSAQALGLIALATTRYDVVLMNPPFGEATLRSERYLDKEYPAAANDLATCFVQAGVMRLQADGLLGAITTRTIFLLAQSKKFRSSVLDDGRRVRLVADLGYNVLDAATVETAAYVVSSSPTRTSTWIRLVNEVDKKASLEAPSPELTYIVDPERFSKLPNTPFCYWLPDDILTLFSEVDSFESESRQVRCGMGTLDDFRYVRCWWEVDPSRLESGASARSPQSGTWVAYAKAGAASSFAIDLPLVVNFGMAGREVKAYVAARVGSPSRKIQAEGFYRRRGIQFGRRVRRLSPAALPDGVIFSDSANAVFVAGDDEEALLAHLALLNGRPTQALFAAFAPARKMEVGYLQRMPVPEIGSEDKDLVELGRRGVQHALTQFLRLETSRYFVWPGVPHGRLEPDFWKRLNSAVEASYGLSADDVQALVEASETRLDVPEPEDENDEDSDDGQPSVNTSVADLSWLVGVVFGRFDPRFATGDRPTPPEPTAFDSLPPRPPGMWPLGTDRPGTPDILVEDRGHDHDIATVVMAAAETAGISTPDPDELRWWISKEFFGIHLRMYTKGRRKAPIYWQLATRSGSYSVWLYVHAFSFDTMFRIQNDHVAPKLRLEEQRLDQMRTEVGHRATVGLRKSIADKEALVSELREMLEDVRRVAPLWSPHLDDGIIINFAPLWRLVPQHKPWQKELKATWNALRDGRYDWARLAMHLWPERVVPKCADDRSLAIAHGLEGVFWEQQRDGKWRKRKQLTQDVGALVRERTSPAVKAALQDLLSAPAGVASGRRRDVDGARGGR